MLSSAGGDYDLTGASALVKFAQTNLEMKFVAPASGTYLVMYNVGYKSPNIGDSIRLGVYNGVTAVDGSLVVGTTRSTNDPHNITQTFVAVLTGGATYNLQAHNATAARGSITINGGGANLSYVLLSL